MSVFDSPFNQVFRNPFDSPYSTGLGGWTPAQLFLASEQGAWYDPSDFSTMFQNAAGTTPVTAVEQPVGLVLDKRLGLVLGSERVTNGAFTGGGTGWSNPDTAPSTTVFSNDSVTMTAAAGLYTARLRQALTLAAGSYEVTLNVTAYSGTPGAALSLGNATSGDATYGAIQFLGVGSYRAIITITGPTLGLAFTAVNALGGSLTIDNVSVKSLPGNHASQSTAASRPVLRLDGANYYIYTDRVDDHLTVAAGGGGTTGICVCAAIRAGGAGNARTIWSDRGTNTGYRLSINASNQLVLSAGNGSAHTEVIGPTVTAGTDYVVTGWHDGTNLNVQLNAGAATSAAFGTATAGTAGFTIGKDNGAATGYYGDRIYEIVYRKNDTSSAGDRASLITYMAAQAGVTL